MKFDNHCAECGKFFGNASYATDRRGTLPVIFCDGACETKYNNKSRMTKSGLSEAEKEWQWVDSQSTEKVAEKLSKVGWANVTTEGQGDIPLREVQTT
jgi:hypothetical protein